MTCWSQGRDLVDLVDLVDLIDSRDEAVERKNEAEVELARCRIESMQVRRLWDEDDYYGGGDDGGDGGDGCGGNCGGDCEPVMIIQWIGVFLVY